MAFEKLIRVAEPEMPRGGEGHPDWHGLQARLLAACEAQRTLGAQRARTGSFDSEAARALERFERSQTINPNASTNGKPGHYMNGRVAGSNSTGDRG